MRGADKVHGEVSHLERMRKAAKRVEPAMWDWHLASNGFEASPRLKEIYGFPAKGQVSFAELVEATHPHDRGWEDPLLARSAREDFDLTIRVLHGKTREIRWLRVKIATAFDPSSLQPIAYTAIVEDKTERTQASYALQESEERLRLAIEAGRMAVWEVDLETGTVTNSPELNLLFGFPVDAKPSFADFRSRYAPGELERLAREGATLEEVRRQFASGKFEVRAGPITTGKRDPTQVQAEVSIIVPDGRRKHLLYRAQYIYSFEGRPKITGLLVDMTDRKEAEERLAVIAGELQHRVKNSFTLVQSLARLSLRSATGDRESVDRFLTRLSALASATNLVLSNVAAGADLADVIESITRPYRDGHDDPFRIAGPAHRVTAKAASAYSLIIHELCTNAVKYGALANPDGIVEIAWKIESDKALHFRWRELGGPVISTPTSTGFGSRLIAALVQGDLKGDIETAYPGSGIEISIKAPV